MGEREDALREASDTLNWRPPETEAGGVKAKAGVKPKVDFKALREGRLEFKRVDVTASLDVEFDGGASMSLDAKARFDGDGGRIESARAEFKTRF